MESQLESWNVVYVASRMEKKVAALLERYNCTYYLPLVEKIRIWSDRKKKIQVPLFNGYLFVKPNAAERNTILSLPGVVKFLRYNNADAVVKPHELDLIKSIIKNGYDISEAGVDIDFAKGQMVHILHGPLKDFNGRIVRMGNDHYALIEFEQFGNGLKVQLPVGIIKKINGITI